MAQNTLFEIKLPAVNGLRLRQARELRSLTQTALADSVAIDQTMIAHIERGKKQPTAELLQAFADILDFPVPYFRLSDPPELARGSLLFRARAGIGSKAIYQAFEESRLALEIALALSARASMVQVRVPSVSDPVEAARETRTMLGIEPGPVENVIRSAERLGVLVIPLPGPRDFDAFATWTRTGSALPIIGLAETQSYDRRRLSVAHELGHLILHRSVDTTSKEHEQQAYIFAAEFLMPTVDIYPELTASKINLFRLAELKKRWRVSMQAILRRTKDLSILTDRQYRYLMLQISQRGWRTEEPAFDTDFEKPRALRKLAEVTFGGKDQWKAIARETHISLKFVQSVLELCEGGEVTNNRPASHANVVAFRAT